jgi:hypothetical protein
VLIHCPSAPTFPPGAEAPVPLIVSLTALVPDPDPEPCASATPANSTATPKDKAAIFNEFLKTFPPLVCLMRLVSEIRMFSYGVAVRKPAARDRRSAIQKAPGLVADDFARAAAPC